ncbi:MAG TPA: hypothetical protein DCS67_06755 [Clostridiales bacterium UBA8960]|jgi:hypothetical protein|nr:hypothetical protein [Clostridiales bacterium UBA8960]
MNVLIEELKTILDCEIEIKNKSKSKRVEQHTFLEVPGGGTFVIHRKLTDLEQSLVKSWIEKSTHAAMPYESNLLLSPEGYKNESIPLKFPINLWRVMVKENSEVVQEILRSTFGTDRIVTISPQENVVFVTKSPMSPHDLLGMLESEALTSSKIVIGNTITHASELYAGYKELLELASLAQLLKQNEQVITYDAFLFPLLIHRLKHVGEPSKSNEEGLITNLMRHHVKSVGDQELEHTALIFFRNNLNITETAGALFIHRNTLIYRLGKLESITGYDIRKFGDAINYYLSYLVETIK